MQEEIDAAAAAAAAAQSAADDAQDDADAANALLTNIASDSKLTASEKQATKKEWDVIQSEKTKNDTQADLYSVSKTAYTNAYNALSTYLTSLLSDLESTSTITGSEFRDKFRDYYNARTDLLNAISNAAKAAAEATAAALDDAIQVGGRNWLKDSQTITLSGSDRPHTRTTVFDNGITTLTVIDAASALSAYDWIQGYLTDDSIADSHAPTTFTVSISVKTNATGFKFSFNVRSPSHIHRVDSTVYSIPDTKGQWMRIGATIEMPDDENERGRILAGISDNGNLVNGDSIQYKDFKLELGNKATDWTPAPEDVQEDYATKLGYSNYATLVAKAKTGSTIISGGYLNTDLIEARSIVAGKIATGTITASEIEAGTITANEIANSTITGGKIAGTTITAANIVNSTITGGKIAGTTITAANIAAGTITANKIDISSLTANSAFISAITAMTITADDLLANNAFFRESCHRVCVY